MSRKHRKRRKYNTHAAAKNNHICNDSTTEYATAAHQQERTRQKEDNSMPMKKKELKTKKSRKNGFHKPAPWRRRHLLMISMTMIMMITLMTVPAFATEAAMETDPIVVVNNLNTFVFGLIRAIGIILLGWGIVQVGLSFQSHDPSQRSNGFLTLAGGLVVTFAKEIMNLIIGG